MRVRVRVHAPGSLTPGSHLPAGNPTPTPTPNLSLGLGLSLSLTSDVAEEFARSTCTISRHLDDRGR